VLAALDARNETRRISVLSLDRGLSSPLNKNDFLGITVADKGVDPLQCTASLMNPTTAWPTSPALSDLNQRALPTTVCTASLFRAHLHDRFDVGFRSKLRTQAIVETISEMMRNDAVDHPG
jgi:hypothetical protein